MSELQDTQEYEFGKEFAELVHLCSLSYDGEAIVKHNFDYAFKRSLKKIVIKYASMFNENMKNWIINTFNKLYSLEHKFQGSRFRGFLANSMIINRLFINVLFCPIKDYNTPEISDIKSKIPPKLNQYLKECIDDYQKINHDIDYNFILMCERFDVGVGVYLLEIYYENVIPFKNDSMLPIYLKNFVRIIKSMESSIEIMNKF